MASGKGPTALIATFAIVVSCAAMMPGGSDAAEGNGLWSVYDQALKVPKYVDLTHTITPSIPVWAGFAESTFAPAKAGTDIEGFVKKGEVYTYAKHGFEATEYALKTDQLGTQLDPPAHWAPEYPAIDELPATYAIRPLVVISIVEQLKANPNYALQVADIEAWEQEHGRIPEGYTQAEGVANLDKVPEVGALVIIGYPKFGGGLGGYARYIAVCPADWPTEQPSARRMRRCRNPTSPCTTTRPGNARPVVSPFENVGRSHRVPPMRCPSDWRLRPPSSR
jgi:kynurenine formamidase